MVIFDHDYLDLLDYLDYLDLLDYLDSPDSFVLLKGFYITLR